jgi:uncharacterized protein (TIGR03066 family)
MRLLCTIAVGMALLSVTARVGADEPKKEQPPKSDEVIAKLLGKWEVTKADEEQLVGAIITFEKDGKFIAHVNEMDHEGTYKIDDKGKLITTVGDMSDSDTIKKLTTDVLELENKDGKVTNMKRKK